MQVKICDFGLSVQQAIGSKEAIGAVDQVEGGTAPYSAPEVLLGKELDEGADVFAFGVIVWEMYARTRPWAGTHAARITQLVGFEDQRLEMPTAIMGAPDMVAIVGSCWKLKTVERPPFHRIKKLVEDALRS